MKHAELEGLAVAYALLIMKDWPVADLNASILAEHGRNALVRVKKRAWQHVRANNNAPEGASPATEIEPREGSTT